MKINTLAKKERLSLRNDIDDLFKNGKALRYTYFRVFYLLIEEEKTTPLQAFFSVPKRLHKRAVARNLLKRRLKEAYRINKQTLLDYLTEKDKNLHIGFLYSSKEVISFQELEKDMVEAVRKVLKKIEN